MEEESRDDGHTKRFDKRKRKERKRRRRKTIKRGKKVSNSKLLKTTHIPGIPNFDDHKEAQVPTPI